MLERESSFHSLCYRLPDTLMLFDIHHSFECSRCWCLDRSYNASFTINNLEKCSFTSKSRKHLFYWASWYNSVSVCSMNSLTILHERDESPTYRDESYDDACLLFESIKNRDEDVLYDIAFSDISSFIFLIPIEYFLCFWVSIEKSFDFFLDFILDGIVERITESHRTLLFSKIIFEISEEAFLIACFEKWTDFSYVWLISIQYTVHSSFYIWLCFSQSSRHVVTLGWEIK